MHWLDPQRLGQGRVGWVHEGRVTEFIRGVQVEALLLSTALSNVVVGGSTRTHTGHTVRRWKVVYGNWNGLERDETTQV